MVRPEITTEGALVNRYPGYFLVDPRPITDVMQHVAEIPDETIEATKISFEAGKPTDLAFDQEELGSFVLNIHAIKRRHDNGYLKLPESWKNTFPEDNLQAATYLTLASVIGLVKAQETIHKPQISVPKSIGGIATWIAVEAAGANVIFQGDPYVTLAGGLLGSVRGLNRFANNRIKKLHAQQQPLVEEFIGNTEVPARLNGALRFDFRV